MAKKLTKTNKNSRAHRKLWGAFFIFLIFCLGLAGFFHFEFNSHKKDSEAQALRAFTTFKGHLTTFIQNKVALIKGFTTFFQTVNDADEDMIYTYLENLISEDIDIIRNIGIIDGTITIWSYPKETNEGIIGVNLLQIPDQRDSVIKTMYSMEYSFEGPMALIQGGEGFIIRVPYDKDGIYQGMVSIVLKAEKVFELLQVYANRSKITVAIMSKSNTSWPGIIFGDSDTVKKAPFVFNADFSGSEWDIYIIPGYDTNSNHFIFILVISLLWLLLTSISTYNVYKFLKNSEDIINKNDYLSMAIMKDTLTGIHNRKYLDARLAEEIENCNRYHGNLSIIFFDLDHFKMVNDNFGHIQGDNVLKKIAVDIKALLRSGDVFGRWGGEEFLILMPGTELENAREKADKLRIFLENIQHPVVGKVTASFGVAQYKKDEFIGSFFNRVDKALYNAKQNGRNLVFVSMPKENDSELLFKIHWKNEWLSGNEKVDGEHKALLKKANELIESSYLDKNSCIIMAGSFLDFAKTHFANEEVELAGIDYHLLDEHKRIHQELIQKSTIMLDRLAKNQVGPMEVLHFIQEEFVPGHLLEEDIKFFGLF